MDRAAALITKPIIAANLKENRRAIAQKYRIRSHTAGHLFWTLLCFDEQQHSSRKRPDRSDSDRLQFVDFAKRIDVPAVIRFAEQSGSDSDLDECQSGSQHGQHAFAQRIEFFPTIANFANAKLATAENSIHKQLTFT